MMNADNKYKNTCQALILPLCLLMLTVAQSCQKKDAICYQPTEASMRVGFSQKTVLEVDSMFDSVLVDTFFITYPDTPMPYVQAFYDDGVNSFRVDAGEAASSISFLLNPNASQTTYSISYDTTSSLRDTITIYHQNHPVFISNDCGFTNFYTIEDVQLRSAGIDSLYINEKEVTMDNSNNKKHVFLYYFND